MKKELDMKVRKVISKTVAERYKKSRKKEKSKILDEFTKGVVNNFVSLSHSKI
jgi:hypothetical protein